MKKIIWFCALAIVAMSASADGDSMSKDALKVYRKRRNLKISPEPYGSVKKRSSKKLRFVIQKHAARALHYDVRLEIDGVLVSWAVPKGPSLNPAIKRLAVRTDDHPMEYAKFEGVIPKGAYGAGTVMVWDIGKYRNIKEDDDGELMPMHECLKKGRIEVFLEGEKLEGAYALVRTQLGEGKDWLMVKMRDEYANARRNPVSTQNKSALTDRTMAEIRADEAERKPRKKVPVCRH